MTHPAAAQALLTPATAAETLQAWQARDAEIRGRNHQIGLGRPEQFVGRSGIEVFRAMLAGEMPRAPISDTLDFFLVEADVGRVEFQGRPQFAQQDLHHAGAQAQLCACLDREGDSGARHRLGDPRGWAHCHRRRAFGRP